MVDSCTNSLPMTVPSHGKLYLAALDPALHRRLWHTAVECRVGVEEPFSGVLTCEVGRESLRRLTQLCQIRFRPAELESIRCHVAPEGREPTLAQLMQAESLFCVVAWIDGQWLGELLAARRLQTHFQPIVSSHQPGSVFAYECLLRATEEDGQIVSPGRLYSAARATGLLSKLDCAARLTAIEAATVRKLQTCIFINFNPRSVENPLQGLRSTVDAAIASGIAPERFVFGIVESDEIVDTAGLVRILDYCRGAGFRVALDDLGAGYSSLNLLATLKPDFVKLDMGLIRDVDQDAYKSRVAGKLLELARELSVMTVVEGVETHGEWMWSVDHGADFAQGYLFARPQLVPPIPNFCDRGAHDLGRVAMMASTTAALEELSV